MLQVHEERFQSRYGRLRYATRRTVEKFLDCGILEHGFARVRCDRIRRHLRRHGRDPYAMHDEWLVAQGRAPP